jgi:PAS domain S-box-containing protein
MHSLLSRHLRRAGLDAATAPGTDAWRALIERLSALLEDADRERYMLERSISISSREMQELYQELKRSSATQLALERDRLTNSLALLNAILETGIDGVLVVGTDRRIVMFNRVFTSIWHIPSEVVERGSDEEMLAHVHALLAEPDEFYAKVQYLYDRPDEPSRDEIRLTDGRVLDRYSAPVRAPDGDVVYGRMWLFRDVTAERRAEQEVRRVNAFLDSIIENLPEMVFVKDAETLSFVRFNRAGEELLGWPRSALIGKSDYDFFPAEEAEFFVSKDREVLRGHDVLDIPEECIQTRSQGTRWLHTKKIPIRDEHGDPKYLLGISHDITELRRHEEELRKARDAAEAASQAKSEFLANMSHELRTPLNAILGFGEVLQDGLHGPLAPRQQRDINHILEGGRHLLRVITDILDLSRVEAGRFEMTPQRLDVFSVVASASELIRPLAEKKQLRLRLGEQDEPLYVRADELRTRQILYNLLSNAVKFTREGGDLLVDACADTSGNVVVSVTDDGIGIAPDDHDRIFAPFEQVDSSYARHKQGTGLGLALTRRLVELQGGTISVESALGAGSTFRFTLPRAQTAETEALAHPPGYDENTGLRSGLRILIIEDNAANLELATTILCGLGYEVICASDADTGIDLARQQQPHLVLLDIGLPGKDGLQAAGELKRDERTRAIPLVALTAHALPADEAKAQRAGFTGYLTKPIRPTALAKLVANVLRSARGPEPTVAPRPACRADKPEAPPEPNLLSGRAESFEPPPS